MARTKQQHYVTRAYLEGFLAQKEKFLVCYGRGKGPFRKQPEDLACQRNYYAVKNPDGTWDDSLEDLIGRMVESPGLPILKKLAKGKTHLSWEERGHLARLIAFQELRTPAARVRMLQSTQAMTDRLVREVRAGNPEQKSVELIGKDGKGVTVTLEEMITSQQALYNDHSLDAHRLTIRPALEIANILVRMRFTVHYSNDFDFITTDTPVVRVFTTRAPLGYGLQRPDIEIRFPLSRQTFLTLTHDLRFLELFEQATEARQRKMLEKLPEIQVRYARAGQVNGFNRGHARHTQMWLFAPQEAGWASQILAEPSAAPTVRDLSSRDLFHFQSNVNYDPAIDFGAS